MNEVCFWYLPFLILASVTKKVDPDFFYSCIISMKIIARSNSHANPSCAFCVIQNAITTTPRQRRWPVRYGSKYFSDSCKLQIFYYGKISETVISSVYSQFFLKKK